MNLIYGDLIQMLLKIQTTSNNNQKTKVLQGLSLKML